MFHSVPKLIILSALVVLSSAAVNSQIKKEGHVCDAIDPQEKALLRAVKSGELALVSQLLRQGVDPNTKDDCGNSAIAFAAQYGQPEIVKTLIAYRADVTSASGIFHAKTPLMLALDWSEEGEREQAYEVIKLLLAAGADVNLRAGAYDTPLTLAVSKEMERAVELLIAAGADINARDDAGRTAYSYAAEIGNRKLKSILLAAGADPRIGVAEYRREFGDSAFIQAAAAGRTDVVEALLAEGTDVNMVNGSDVTALMRVVNNSTLDALLSAGADVNRRDNAGFTALMWAAVTGRSDVVERLIAAGADVNVRNNDRETALDLAKPEVREVLLHVGAKPGRSVLSRVTLK
ncbi:MAG TPA: ankyrin repeat domain-containing protein [Pyrinomonadaceae bacterium]